MKIIIPFCILMWRLFWKNLVNEGFNATAKKGQIVVQAEGAEVEFIKVHLTQL